MIRHFILATILFLVALSAPAADLTVTLPGGQACVIPLNVASAPTIKPQSGDLVVTALNSEGCGGPGNASTPTAAAEVVVTFTSGLRCIIPLGINPIEFNPATLDVAIATTASTVCGAGAPSGAPVFNTPLTASPASIAIGAQTTLVWQTTGSTSCTGSVTRDGVDYFLSGWTGTRPFGTAGVSFQLNATGSYLFTLTCANASSSTTSRSTVTVGSTSGCSASSPSFGLQRQTTMTNASSMQGNTELPLGTVPTVDWNYFFGNSGTYPWPTRVQNGTLAVKYGKFIALEFVTPASVAPTYGTLQWVPPAHYGGAPLVVISECAGDFHNMPATTPASPNTICRDNAGGYSTLAFGMNVTDPNACRLRPSTRYYVNVAFVQWPTGSSSCLNPEPAGSSNPTACRWFAQPR